MQADGWAHGRSGDERASQCCEGEDTIAGIAQIDYPERAGTDVQRAASVPVAAMGQKS